GTGDDWLDGGVGADAMYGNSGNDTYVVDDVNDSVNELANEGTDTVQSYIAYSLTNTNLEHLKLIGSSAINGTGNALNNLLTGNGVANTLSGAAGNDVLEGMDGNDILTDTSGNNVFNGGL